MFELSSQIHAQGSHGATTRWPAQASAAILAGIVFLGAWAVLRQPAIREFLVRLVPHRYPIAFAVQRQLLAPRSVALAGCVLMAWGMVQLLWARRWPSRSKVGLTTAFFVALQTAVALAVVLNLNFYFLRTFGRPVCAVPRESILRHWVPQAYPHAKQLANLLSPDTRVAIHPEGGTFNLYLLTALAYPVAFYDAAPVPPDASPSHPVLQHLVRSRGVEYFLHYVPMDTTHPLRLRRIMGE